MREQDEWLVEQSRLEAELESARALAVEKEAELERVRAAAAEKADATFASSSALEEQLQGLEAELASARAEQLAAAEAQSALQAANEQLEGERTQLREQLREEILRAAQAAQAAQASVEAAKADGSEPTDAGPCVNAPPTLAPQTVAQRAW